MNSWVDIKKENQTFRVPYQAFLDAFEKDGFKLVDKQLNVEPTFSKKETNEKKGVGGNAKQRNSKQSKNQI
jgi:hypothetical protein